MIWSKTLLKLSPSWPAVLQPLDIQSHFTDKSIPLRLSIVVMVGGHQFFHKTKFKFFATFQFSSKVVMLTFGKIFHQLIFFCSPNCFTNIFMPSGWHLLWLLAFLQTTSAFGKFSFTRQSSRISFVATSVRNGHSADSVKFS